MSAEGKNCPCCGKDIGVWVIVKAPWPGKMKCKHCGSAFTYEKKGGQWFLLLCLSIS